MPFLRLFSDFVKGLISVYYLKRHNSCFHGTDGAVIHFERFRIFLLFCSMFSLPVVKHFLLSINNSLSGCSNPYFVCSLCTFINLYAGDILPKVPAKPTGASRAQLKELALYFALCGPSWNGILPCSSRDVWPTLSAGGRCYLNSLLSRLRPQELGDLFMRGQSVLDAVEQFRGGTTMWVHTLRRLINVSWLDSMIHG